MCDRAGPIENQTEPDNARASWRLIEFFSPRAARKYDTATDDPRSSPIHHNSLDTALSGIVKLRTLLRNLSRQPLCPAQIMNLEQARTQMLGQQIRAWEVLDDRVLGVLGTIAREAFVPASYRDLAFADLEIPLDHGQNMMAPKIEGRLLQALRLDPNDSVLEIGTGSGFLTACLAKLAASVVTIDIFDDFSRDARSRLDSLGMTNIEYRTEDALAMDANHRFDAIAVTGSVPELDDHFVRMLRPGGRLFIIVGREPVMEARVVTMLERGQTAQDSLFESVVKPLINAERPKPFVL
jgi:protein-L-isoaspartate(D-aspartate) O-methyltransferase